MALPEHEPALDVAKVGMRCPARVLSVEDRGVRLDLDLRGITPRRFACRNAELRFEETVAPGRARLLRVGERIEVVLIEVSLHYGYIRASLPAVADWLTWNNGTIRQLAQRVRATGETVLLPVLADALEEAGCTDAGLLEHCRHQPPYERNWCVELLAAQELSRCNHDTDDELHT
jgi:hypothetical protein